MANDLVVNLGARLDQFSADMDQAGNIADSTVAKIEQSFARLNPGINLSGLTTLAAGAAAGFSALLALVASLNSGLADMAKQAERVGLSLERFQQLKFGAAALGVGDAKFGADMEAFAGNAQVALSKANDLKRVFDANGVSITNANGKLKETNDLFEHAVDIIKRAPSIGDALQMGQFLGLSKEFAQAIYDSGDAFLRLAASANAAGAVIDDATIQKASLFTAEWNKASAIWGAQMKAAVLEFLPLINDAIGAAKSLLTYVGTAVEALSAIKDFAIAPNVDTASLAKLQSLNDEMTKIQAKMEAGQTLNPIEAFRASNAEDAAGNLTLESVDKYLALIRDRILNFNKDPSTRITIRTDASKNPGVRQQTDESRDQFEVAVDQLQKRTTTLKADTATTFENATAQARLRAEFGLLNAIVRDEGEVTEAQLEKYEKLRTSMSATQALQESGIVLTKEHAAAFDEVTGKIAQATDANTKARQSLQQLNQASQVVGSALSTAFADAIVDGKSLNEVLNGLIKTLEKAAINALIMQAFAPGVGGGLAPVLSFLGIGKRMAGGPVSPGTPYLVGEAGPELMVPSASGMVVPNAVLGRSGGDATNIVYNIDATGADTGTVERIQTVLTAHAKAITAQGKAMTSTQRLQATGVA